MRDELNMSPGSYATGSYAGAGMGAVNASFRVPRRQDGGTGSMRKMGIIAAIVAVVIVVILAASGFMSARKAGLPVVQADSRPLRVKPDKTSNAALESDEAMIADAKPGTATLAPAPEVPATAALKKQALEAAQAQAAADAAAKARLAAVAPIVAPPAPSVYAAAPPPVAKPVAPAAPLATVAPPATRPAKPAVGAVSVQLAALVSEPNAQAEWDRLAKKFPGLFAGHKPVVSKFERDGKTFWRLRTAGFADPVAAASFCDKARAGGQACLVEKT